MNPYNHSTPDIAYKAENSPNRAVEAKNPLPTADPAVNTPDWIDFDRIDGGRA